MRWSIEGGKLLIKNLIYTIFFPGNVAVLVPSWLLARNANTMPHHWGFLQYLALLSTSAGIVIYFQCVRDFAIAGRGTPSPFDPPSNLVVRGPYRFVRNPLYLAVLVMLLSETVFFESWALLRYTVGYIVTVHLIVVLYEEPKLRHTFGASYDRYSQCVRRWLPGKNVPREHRGIESHLLTADGNSGNRGQCS